MGSDLSNADTSTYFMGLQPHDCFVLCGSANMVGAADGEKKVGLGLWCRQVIRSVEFSYSFMVRSLV